MPKNIIMKNIFILGISGIIAKTFDFVLRAFYSRALGAEGMGLLSLGFSLHGVMLTFATAGLGVAVSKIASEYMEQKNYGAVRECMHLALFGVCTLSMVLQIVVFLGADIIAASTLGDGRAASGLCALSPSVLFMGISYCLKGYFYAARKTLQPASSELLEQCVKLVSIALLLKRLLPYGTEYGCTAVFGGISIGELSSCAYLSFFYLKEERALSSFKGKTTVDKKNMVCKLLGISLPSMITSLCCSALRASEEILIVNALKRGKMEHSAALGMLGVLKGMAMPLLVLPLNLAGSVMSLLVPEISRASVGGKAKLKAAVVKVYKTAALAGTACAVVFTCFGGELTTMLYGTNSAARLVTVLAPLCPVMFADSVSCSMLNGMGKQLRLLLVTLADFMLRFTVIYFFIPTGKEGAFVAMTAISNIFTCMLTCFGVAGTINPFGKSVKLTKRVKCGIVDK